MKHKKSFIFLILLIFSSVLFAEELPPVSGQWINAPFLQMLTYFCNMESKWLLVARDIAFVMVLLNIIWQCMQIAFGTTEVRKALVSSFTKWFVFLFIMCMYPAFNVGLLKFSQEVSQKVDGGGLGKMGKAFADYYAYLSKVITEKKEKREVAIKLAQYKYMQVVKEKEEWGKEKTENQLDNPLLWDYYTQKAYETKVKQALKELKSAQNMGQNDISTQTYNILASVFKPTKIEDGKVVNWNINLNMLYNKTYASPDIEEIASGKKRFKRGKSTEKKADLQVISPDAIMKTLYLAACVMWEREWTAINEEWEENKLEAIESEDSANFAKKIIGKMSIVHFPFHRIAEVLFCIILIICMVMCGSVAVIQYMMCLMEYSLICGAAAILVPFMLFDGLSDMAQKVISVLFQQALKFIFCNLSIYFVIWSFFLLAQQCVGAQTGLSLQNIFFGLFICILGGAVMTNAPKLASVLATGTPQMSMGEALQMAGSYMAAGRLGAKAIGGTARLVTTAGKMGKEGVRKTGQAALSGAGKMNRSVGAYKGAKTAALNAGVGKIAATGYGLRAAASQGIQETEKKIKGATKNFFTSNPSGSKGGAGSSGAPAGDNNPYELTSDLWTNTPDHAATAQAHNMTYGKSLHYEKDTDSGKFVATRSQTLKEHLNTQKEDAKKLSFDKYKAYFTEKAVKKGK